MTIRANAYATLQSGGPLVRWEYEIREPLEDEILIEVAFCGLSHQDTVEMLSSEDRTIDFPFVPGSEISGFVRARGSKVTTCSVGDKVAVGGIVRSCGICDQCAGNEEQFCQERVRSCGDRDTRASHGESMTTCGGYGQFVVVSAAMAVRVPDEVPLICAAPLMGAGITAFSPIENNHMGRGNLRIAVFGIGGVGHMAIQFASKINASNEVIAFTRNPSKEQVAVQLGAKKCIGYKNAACDLSGMDRSFDYIICTVDCNGIFESLAKLLKPRGSFIMLGTPMNPTLNFAPRLIAKSPLSIQGSYLGGKGQIERMLSFCSEHSVLPQVEEIKFEDFSKAYERMKHGHVRFRFVFNVKNSFA